MTDWLVAQIRWRPWWANGAVLVCLYLSALHFPAAAFDAAPGPETRWLGMVLPEAVRSLGTVLHAVLCGVGVYGFWRMKSWMWPWASAYAAQGALSVLAGFDASGRAALDIALAGTLAASAVGLAFARGAFRRPLALRARYGEWALVTGASSGLGEEFVRALAAEGISCVLVARRGERMRRIAEEVEKEHAVATRVLVADLASSGGIESVLRVVEDLDLGLLVSNAGFGAAGRFDRLDPERLRRMVELHCVAPTLLIAGLMPGMQARGRGAIVITGSTAGRQPLPFENVYSATKAFGLFLGESLWGELLGSGVDVLVVEPGPTATEFPKIAGALPHPAEPPARVVATALEALGRQASVISGWWNWILAQAGRIPPRPVTLLVARALVARKTPADLR